MESTKYLAKRLIRNYVLKHKLKLIGAIICMILVAGATAGLAYMLEPVLDKIFLEKDLSSLVYIPIIVILLALVKGAATYGHLVLTLIVGQRIVSNMQKELFEHLLHCDLKVILGESSGKLVSRFINDINIMRRSVSSVFTSIVKESFTLIALIGVMFAQSWQLALIAFFVFPTAIYPIARIGKNMRKLSTKTQNELGEFTHILDESFQGIRTIKAYGKESFEIKKANNLIERVYILYKKAFFTESISSPIMETLGGISIAAVIWYGGSSVISGTTTPGSFFSFITALLMAYKPMKTLSVLNANLQEGLAAGKRFFNIIDIEKEVKDNKSAKNIVLNKSEIEFKDVSFGYDNKLALNKVSFIAPSKKVIALVGHSGSGKSTIMNLLLRFYDPDNGKILIDNQDIKTVKQKSLRDNIAYVGQEVILFADSIANNIAYGSNYSLKDIKQAARLAAADEFIDKLPNGYKTILGKNGVNLSGGQRQRLSIARAFLRDSKILLLDEATSALDPISEQKIQESLKTLMQDKTVIVIAHRLSTVVNSDIIYVLKHGKVVENGKHSELIEKKGEYQKLYKKLS